MKISELDRPDQAIARSDIRPGKRKTYRALDLINISQSLKHPNILAYTVDKIVNNPEFQQPGIYVFSHPDFGIFYVGLNGVAVGKQKNKGVAQRWQSHLDKMLDRTKIGRSAQTAAWKKFSTVVAQHSRTDISKAADDLDQIMITYIPFTGSEEELDRRETRLRQRLNPYANYDRHTKANITRPSSTRVEPFFPK